MSYVGTPRYLGSDLQTLASILQGEAGGEGPQGLQAVASVIQNRAKQNFSGYGSDPISQALAKNQFQGQSPHPSPEALAVAQQLAGGSLANDPTHGALYYANPGASSASWARNLNPNNSLQIGHHYFTDNTSGNPFAGAAPGPDGPKGQEAYAQPVLGPSPQPSLLGPPGIPQDVAAYAADDSKSLGDKLQGVFGKLAQTPDAPQVRFGPMGDARNSGGDLLKALNAPTLSDLLSKKRLVG
jgi:hypothetical protein